MKSSVAEKVLVFGDKVKRAMTRFRQDGYTNVFTGLGTDRDKMTFTLFSQGRKLDDEELDALYHENDMAALICDIVPDEMLRKGYDIKGDQGDEDKLQDVQDGVDALDTNAKFADGMAWARAFGASALLLGIDDGSADLTLPLNEENIRSFTHINVLDKRFMQPIQWYDDPSEPKFGIPKTYLITPEAVAGSTVTDIPGAMEIHESRMVIFGGVRTTIRRRQQNNGFQEGVLQRIHTVLEQFGVSWQSLAHVMQDANQGVFKFGGLMAALAEQDFATIQARMELIDMSRSVARAIAVDPDQGEDFVRQNFNWSGSEKPLEMFMLRLSAAARIPVTILMGQSPAGMNATGESDFRWFYDQIASAQENKLEPDLSRVVKLVQLAKDGPTGGQELENWRIEFEPLWEMTPKEEAEVRKLQSETDKNNIETQMVLPEEAALSRFTPDGWKPDTVIDRELRETALDNISTDMNE